MAARRLSEKGRENMHSGTAESTRMAVASFEININSHVLEGRYCIHFLKDSCQGRG